MNPDKFHLLFSDKKFIRWIFVDKIAFGDIDNKLIFEEHAEGLFKKASQKDSALARISSLIRFEWSLMMLSIFMKEL